jgi:chromosome segregation ATPase
MTEIVFQKLEEKVMQVLADFEKSRAEADEKRNEVDHLRNEIQRMSQEIISLKQDRDNNARKLQDLVSLLDSVGSGSGDMMSNASPSPTLLAVKPVLVQDKAQGQS